MEIKSNSNEIVITGNIKTMKDFQDIKSCVDSVKTQSQSVNETVK